MSQVIENVVICIHRAFLLVCLPRKFICIKNNGEIRKESRHFMPSCYGSCIKHTIKTAKQATAERMNSVPLFHHGVNIPDAQWHIDIVNSHPPLDVGLTIGISAPKSFSLCAFPFHLDGCHYYRPCNQIFIVNLNEEMRKMFYLGGTWFVSRKECEERPSTRESREKRTG